MFLSDIERPQLTPIEFNWAVKQLVELGIIKCFPDDTAQLTELGAHRAAEIEWGMTAQDRLVMIMFYAGLGKGEDDE